MAAGLASLNDAEGRVLDVLLRGSAHEEGWDVDHLLADRDVSAADQNTGMVDGGGQLALEDERLQASLHELSDSKSQHIIELALRLLDETQSDHTSDDGFT